MGVCLPLQANTKLIARTIYEESSSDIENNASIIGGGPGEFVTSLWQNYMYVKDDWGHNCGSVVQLENLKLVHVLALLMDIFPTLLNPTYLQKKVV